MYFLVKLTKFNLTGGREKVLWYLGLFLLFFFASYIALDPDFGWHIRFGQLVLQSRHVPLLDPFSYSMPSYHFVNHEWLLDVSQSFLYPFIGRVGLALLFTLVMLLSIYLVERLTTKKIPFFILLTAVTSLLAIGGLRDQVFSWLFFSCLLHLLYNQALKKYLPLLPIFFLLWANIHGGFLLGIAFLWLFLLSRTIEQKSLNIKQLGVFTISTLITFMNPYGINLWLEVIRSSPGVSLTTGIIEWLPVISTLNIANAIFLVISCALIILGRKSLRLSEGIPFLFLLFLGCLHIRHFPFFVLYSLYLIPRMLHQFTMGIKSVPYALERYSTAIRYVSIGIIFLISIQLVFLIRVTFMLAEENEYPTKAVVYLLEHPTKRIFAPYDWGGYILWKLPDTKVFIDGRMPHWKQEEKEHESQNANHEAPDLLSGKIPLVPFLKKYNVDTFLLPSYFPSYFTSVSELIDKLENLGWKEVYRDNTSLVIQRQG